jgi:cell division protein ZapA
MLYIVKKNLLKGISAMAQQKSRYKAVIDNQSYTIIGHKSREHMDAVCKLVNTQLTELKEISPQMDNEQAAILLAINALSDQLDKQDQLLKLQKEQDKFRKQAIKVVELENRIRRIEAIEAEAKSILQKNGQRDVEIHSHVEAQQIVNENRKTAIKRHAASK